MSLITLIKKLDQIENDATVGLFESNSQKNKKITKPKSANKKQILESVIKSDKLFEDFDSIGKILVEKKLSEKEILDIFAAAEKELTAAGENRTVLGKGKDLAGSISKAFQNVADRISKSGPVSGFDSLVDQLTDKMATSAGGQDSAVMQAIKKYRDFAKKHPVMQGAVYAGLIALAGLSGAGLGGAALLGGVKFFDKMLLGNKASSALWSGFTTGAVAYGVGQAQQYMQGGTPAAPVAEPTASVAPATVTVTQGETLSGIAQQNGVSVKDMLAANPQITNPDVIKAGQELVIPAPTGAPVYADGVGTAADTAAKIKSGEYSDAYPTSTGTPAPAAPAAAPAPSGSTTSSLGNIEPNLEKPPESGAPAPDEGPRLRGYRSGDGNYRAGMLAVPDETSSSSSGTISGITGDQIVNHPAYKAAYDEQLSRLGDNPSARALQTAKTIAATKAKAAIQAAGVMESIALGILAANPVKIKKPIYEAIDINMTEFCQSLEKGTGKKHNSVILTQEGVYSVFENVERYQRHIINCVKNAIITEQEQPETQPGRAQISNVLRPDMPKAPAAEKKPGLLSRAWSGLKKAGHQFTTKITAEKLKTNWHEEGKQTDSEEIAAFLKRQGVPDAVISSIYQQMSITPQDAEQATTTDTGVANAAEPAATATPAAAPAAAAATTPAAPSVPAAGQEIEMPGTNYKYKFTPGWVDAAGKPAPAAVATVLDQLATGKSASDIRAQDLMKARQNLGLTESKKIAARKLNK
jgi:LysM repeat protein